MRGKKGIMIPRAAAKRSELEKLSLIYAEEKPEEGHSDFRDLGLIMRLLLILEAVCLEC